MVGAGAAAVELAAGAAGALAARADRQPVHTGFRFHDLRHFFVTEPFRGGGSAPAVQALAGHLHLSTTERLPDPARLNLKNPR